MDATNAGNYDDDEPMDEDDQRELVKLLQLEAAAQSSFFQKVFGYGIGGTAIFLSLVFPLLCPDECSADRGTALACWSHSVFSCGVHARMIHPFVLQSSSTTTELSSSTTSSSASTSLTITTIATNTDIALQVIPILLWLTGFFSKDEDHFHLALLISNLVTYLGAHLVFWDMQATQKELESLDAARYKHKAL